MQTELATISPVPDFLSAIPDVATRSEAIALDSEYSALRKKTAKQMWQMGRICRQQKEILEPHGVYHQWLAYQGISTSTASAWVNTDIFADIDPELFEAAVDNFVSSALLRVSAPSFRKENPAGVELAMAIAASGEKVDTSTVEAIAKTPDALIREAIALTREGEVPSRKLLQDLQERTRNELVRQAAELYAPWGEFRAITAEDRAIALGDLSRWHYVFVGVEQIKPFTSPEAAVEAHGRVCTLATRKVDDPLTRNEIEGYYRTVCDVVEWSPTATHPDRLLVKRTSDPSFSSEFFMLQSAWVEWKNLRAGWLKLGEIPEKPSLSSNLYTENPQTQQVAKFFVENVVIVDAELYEVVGIEESQIQCVRAGDDTNKPEQFYFFEEHEVQLASEVPKFGTRQQLATPKAPAEHSLEVLTSNKSDQHYTPEEIKNPLPDAFGGETDLDPCSNSKANPNIPAKQHFTQEDDGLAQPWNGNVYVNAPYSVRLLGANGQPIVRRDSNGIVVLDRHKKPTYRMVAVIQNWVEKAISEVIAGNTQQLIMLTRGDHSTDWNRQLMLHAQAKLEIDHRLKHLCPVGEDFDVFGEPEGAASFASALWYFGSDSERFAAAYEGLGFVFTDWRSRDKSGAVIRRRSWENVRGNHARNKAGRAA